MLPTDDVLWFSAGFSFIFVFYNLLRCGFDLKTCSGADDAGTLTVSSASYFSLGLRSLSLQQHFYVRAAGSAVRWRIQREAKNTWRSITLPPAVKLILALCGRCINRETAPSGAGERQERATDHDLISSINLVTASTAAGLVCHATACGSSGIKFDIQEAGGLGSTILSTLAAVCWQSVLEYYWHRMMHLPPFYKRFHKVTLVQAAAHV
jgi:hypothetical protein